MQRLKPMTVYHEIIFVYKKEILKSSNKQFCPITMYSAYLLRIAFTRLDPMELKQIAVHLSEMPNC